jgi:hypothetical protein
MGQMSLSFMKNILWPLEITWPELEGWLEARKGEGKEWIRLMDCFTDSSERQGCPWKRIYSEADKDPRMIELLS